MRFLAWKKIRPEFNNRLNGFRILLLLILAVFSLRVAFNNPSLKGPLCNEKVFVQVEGDIRYPGVYSFPRKIKPTELIERGEGSKLSENLSVISDNIPLQSGVRVIVQRSGDGWILFRDEISAFYKVTLGIPVSLNRESEKGLTAVPGIGPKLARIIVMERNKRGGFKNLYEINALYGVGNKVYKEIIPYIKL